MVLPDCQRQGIGSKLLSTAVETYRHKRISTVRLGANAELPFWQGIPTCLSAAKQFFGKRGWQIYEKSYDLIMDLRSFEPPGWVGERPRQHGIRIRMAKTEDASALFQYLEAAFPDWHRWFVREVEAGRASNIVVAWKESQIVGSMLMNDLSSPGWTGRQ